MNYVYIDESGETGRSSNFIIIASISTSRPRSLEKAIRKIWRVKPALHVHGELHAYSTDDSTRRRVLQTINDLDLSIEYIVIDKEVNNSSIESTYYIELARLIDRQESTRIIVVDKKDTNKKRQRMISDLGLSGVFENVLFEESNKVKGLQAADFVAWAIGRKYEQDDNSFMELLARINQV